MTDATILAAREAIANGRNWPDITNKPTTLAGYGIADAYTEAEVDALVAGAGSIDGAGTTDVLAKWGSAATLADSLLSESGTQVTLAGKLRLDQGAADDSILLLKSSDIAHGMTDFEDADVYGAFIKSSAVSGGLAFRGLSSGINAFAITGYIATASTTKSSAGVGNISFNAVLKSGTGGTSLGADGNILSLRDNGSTKFIFDASARFHIVGAGSIFIGGAQVVSTRQTGWAAATGTPTRSTFATGSVTTAQLAERVKALIDDLISHGLIGA